MTISLKYCQEHNSNLVKVIFYSPAQFQKSNVVGESWILETRMNVDSLDLDGLPVRGLVSDGGGSDAGDVLSAGEL